MQQYIASSGVVSGIGTGAFTPLIALVSVLQPATLYFENQDLTNNAFGEVAFDWGDGSDPVIWNDSLIALGGADGAGILPGGIVSLDIPDRRPFRIRVRGKAAASTVSILAVLWPAGVAKFAVGARLSGVGR